MKENETFEKTLDFAVRIVNLYKFLTDEKKEFVMSKQIYRSGTSIGANFSEALSAESNLDFIHKLSISQKEANETIYWLKLLNRTEYLSELEYNSIMADCLQLHKIITSIILTEKSKLSKSSHE